MRYLKKVISVLLSGVVLMSSTFSVAAQTPLLDGYTEEDLRLAIRGSEEEVAEAPNGVFDFLATQMTTSEDIKSAEITVLRKGGTEGPATVTLKIVDVSAEYGKDYVIKVPTGFIQKTLPKNSNAPMLIESFEEENIDITVSSDQDQDREADEQGVETVEDGNQESDQEAAQLFGEDPLEPDEASEQLEEEEEAKDESDHEASEQPGEKEEDINQEVDLELDTPLPDQFEEESEDELDLVEINPQGGINIKNKKNTGLARAYQNSVGREANKTNWRLSSLDEAQQAKEQNDKFLSEIDGVTYDLEFADGEYMKKLYFCTLDDEISESEEQVILSLQNPTAGKLGYFNSAYMNIKDNEDFEKPEFALEEKTVYVRGSDRFARVTLERTAGLYHYASLIAATAGITAKEDVDYKATSKELVFVPGVKSQTVEIPLIPNENDEDGDKAFSIMFGEKSSGGFKDELTALVVIQKDENTNILAQIPENRMVTAALSTEALPTKASTVITDTEKIVSVPISSFKRGLGTMNGGNYGYWPESTGPTHPEAVFVHKKAGSFGTMFTEVNLYGVDQISWVWHNDVYDRSNTISTMGLLNYPPLKETKHYSQPFRPLEPWFGNGGFTFSTWTGGISEAKLIPKVWTSGLFTWNQRTHELTDDEKFDPYNNGIYFRAQNVNKDGLWLYIYDVKLHYKKYKIEIGNNYGDKDANDKDDPDCYIVPRKYIGTKTYEEDPSIYIGKIKVKDNVTGGFMGDTITFEADFDPRSNIDPNKVYLWGFKVENKTGQYVKRFEGTTLTLNEATLRELSSNNSLLNDKDTIKIKPIYKQKTQFVQVLFDSKLGGISGFNNLDDIMINAYDTVSLNGYAYTPNYAAGYLVEGYNRSEKASENDYPYHSIDISEQINPANPGKIDRYRPTHDRQRLTLLFDKPELNIRYHPGLGNDSYNDRGEVATDSGAETGRYDTPIRIKPSIMDKTYQIIGNPADNYQVSWRDFTGDVNNDGILSPEEKLALSDGNVMSRSVFGNTFYYRPLFPYTKIYYTLVPRDTGDEELSILGNVYLRGGTVLNKNGSLTPIEGAAVSIGNETVYTNETGYFISKSRDYKTEGEYSLKINYKGFDFISRSEVAAANIHIISAFDKLVPENFKVYKTPKDKSEILIKPNEVDNGASEYRFTFRANSTMPTVKAAKAIIRVYSKDGKSLRMEKEIASNSNDFELKMIPSEEGILPGDYMTLQLTDNNEVTYFENKVGFSFIQSLDTQTFNFLQSFRTPISPVLDFFGKINLVSDLGLAGNVKDYFTDPPKDNEIIMSIGFSKGYNRIKNTEKIETVRESSSSASVQKETTDSAVDKSAGNTKKTSVTSSISFGISFGIEVIMHLDQDVESEFYGQYYFKQMVLMGSLYGSYGEKYEIMTPLGIPVFITWDIMGEVSVAYAYEQYDKKQFYFDLKKPINLANAGTNNTNRDFTVYGNYYIKPSIKIGAGVGYSLLNVSLDGRADFELNFTTIGEGSGKVTLSAYLSIKILFYSKSWGLASKSWPLFGNPNLRYSLFSNGDYRYDSIDTLEQMPRDYLAGRASWNGGSNKNKLFASSDGIEEQSLLPGSYPYPETKMVKYGDQILMVFIDDDGSRTLENRTILKYSIFDGSNWNVPIPVDDDGTLDCEPNLFDLGDRILLTWSDAEVVLPEGTNVIETLSSLNICGVFFDKDKGEFGQITQITKTTDEDVAADNMPTVAYDEVSDRIILYYTKTEYAPPTPENGEENEQTEAFVGDVLNGFSLIAYTFYDDDTGWKSSYTHKEKEDIMANASPPMSEEEFAAYEESWYGQQFLDLAPEIMIDESEVMESSGYWKEGMVPTVSASINEEAKVLESSAISYNQLSLFAYVLDLDGDQETFDDQEIYMQIYDFKDKIFTHTIQITNDDKKDSNIRFIRNGGDTYLYFISGGDIKYTDISSIVKSGLKKVSVDGREFYILDKSKDSEYDRTITVVTQREGNPCSEFEVKTDDANNIYLVWPEILTTFKDGIDQMSEEATLPGNQYHETQIFIARYSYEEQELPDGEIVSIGNWSNPIQYTQEKGANLTELDFVIMDDGTLKAVYNKSYSKVSEENHVINDENNTTLTTANFVPTSNVLFSPAGILFNEEIVQANSRVYILTRVLNDGLETLKGYKAKIYQGQNDVKTLLSESSLDNFGIQGFPGGTVAVVGSPWDVPEDLENLYIEIVIEDPNGFFLSSIQKFIKQKTFLELSELSAELTDVDTASVTVTVTNLGNKKAKEEFVFIYWNDSIIAQEEVDLDVGESRQITMEVNLADKFTSAVDENSTITEKAELTVSTRDTSLYYTVERTASAEDMERMELIKDLSFENSNLSIRKGSEDTLVFNTEDTYTIDEQRRTFNSLFDIVWKSSDESVAKVFQDGSVVAVNKGSATIGAYVLPKSNTYYATNVTNPKYITGLETKASAAVKYLEAKVTVTESGGGSGSGGSSSAQTPTDVPEKEIINILESKKLVTKAYTLGTEENPDCLVLVDKDGNIVPYSYYDPSTGMMNAWVDDESKEYEIRHMDIDFTDTSGMWYEKVVQFLAARNIVTGTGENRFEPEANIKRADFVLLLVRLLGLSGETTDSYEDVDPQSYYANAISIAKQKGIILGQGDGLFNPEGEISRQDMFTIAHRALTIIGQNSGSGSSETYTDEADIADYAKESINFLTSLNLIKGYDGAIDPRTNCRRSEIAQFVYNLYQSVFVQ